MVGCRFGRVWVVHFGLLILHPVERRLVECQILKRAELNIVWQHWRFGNSRENFNEVVKQIKPWQLAFSYNSFNVLVYRQKKMVDLWWCICLFEKTIPQKIADFALILLAKDGRWVHNCSVKNNQERKSQKQRKTGKDATIKLWANRETKTFSFNHIPQVIGKEDRKQQKQHN